MNKGLKRVGISGVILSVALLAACGGGDDPVAVTDVVTAPAPVTAASLTCDITKTPGGTTPTAAQLTAFAKTYQGEEGTYSEDFSSFTVTDPDADVSFSADGATTYNGSSLAVTSACHEVLPGGAGEMLVLYVGSNVHFDLFSDGALVGIAPSGNAVRSPGG